jgi:energy-coupling factor transport system permease protein
VNPRRVADPPADRPGYPAESRPGSSARLEARRGARDSYLGRRNPVIKLAALLVVIGALTFVFDPWTPALFLLLALAVGRGLGGLSLGKLVRILAVFLPALVGVLLANVLFNRLNAGAAPLVTIGPVAVTASALRTAGSLGFRMLAFAAFSAVFVLTTDPSELLLSLAQQLRMNYRVAYGTMAGYRMVPLLRSEFDTIRSAHRARGLEEPPGLLGPWRQLVRYAVPLLAGAVRRGTRVALAMDARAFGAFSTRTYRRRLEVGAGDWAFLVGTVLTAAGLIAALTAAGITRFGIGA